MQELVVISGKGGTGKTSLVASLTSLAEPCVVADCDVDAADLHLVLAPTVVRRDRFSGGSRARIRPGHCTACGKCLEICRFGAITFDGPGNGRTDKTCRIEPIACEGCGVCAYFCPDQAIEFGPVVNGQWFISTTRHGPMVHAKLGVAEENSGKLVSLVRREAKRIAFEQGFGLIVVDGSPGIGCPVIASITGADLVLVVTEPTPSGVHDLYRVTELTRHFGIQALVAVNKWDLNPELSEEIEKRAGRHQFTMVGRIRYDARVTQAQIQARSIVEHADGGAAEDIRQIWSRVETAMRAQNPDRLRVV